MDTQLKVGDTDEDTLVALLTAHLPPGDSTLVGPGDDAAVVATSDGRFVVTTDVLVEGQHFRRQWSSGADVGVRAGVQNLADVAAMGARPTALVVAVTLPGDLPLEFVTGLADGLAQVCRPLGVGVVGGDLSAGPVVTVAVTAHGDLEGRGPVLRSGARAGDAVAHAGVAGWSAAGLALLTADLAGHDRELVAAYLRPSSPLAAGPAAARGSATSMLDVSDGLVRDARRIATASGVCLELDDPADVFADDLARLAPAATRLSTTATTWVLGGGEDHGLLATFPPGPLPDGFRKVGRVVTGSGVTVAGAPPPPSTAGWDHFSR
ncbi:MAG: thiamine-phosphate kinase [Micrococcales bacterium]|nr:thiamine-phosphate kinase [Micrococcales bacterium]MCL2666873.1 thiamine-phosphate kinase [Micrococcales bacterium]